MFRGEKAAGDLHPPVLPHKWVMTTKPGRPTRCKICGSSVFYYEARRPNGVTQVCVANVADGTYHQHSPTDKEDGPRIMTFESLELFQISEALADNARRLKTIAQRKGGSSDK